MPRPIDADALFYKLCNTDPNTKSSFCDGIAKAMEFILNAPTIDTVHGQWGEYEVHERAPSLNGYPCSNCGQHEQRITAYCPNCGAKMDDNDNIGEVNVCG